MATARRITFPVQPPHNISSSKTLSSAGENKDVNEPSAVFKNVDYKRRGEAQLPENYRRVVAYVEQNFVVPADFEVSGAYGVHSGSCFERRLIAAFTWGQLSPKDGVRGQKMCVECGRQGHFRDDCEDLLKQ